MILSDQGIKDLHWYIKFMHAWVTYELVQILHIYGLMPLVRSDLKDVSLDLLKIEIFLRDRTNQDANDSKHAEAMIKLLFADTEHSAIFKKMIMGNMSYFKQLTAFAIPFLLITWLQQLKEHFFLKHDADFFVKGMYTSILNRARNITTTNNIWMMLNPSVRKDSERADSLSFFEPKWRKEVCATLREWAAFILKCEYEPPTLDATSKAILKQSHLKNKKYTMLYDDLRLNTFHEGPEKKSKAKTTPINVTKMTNKDLYLNACQALT